MASNHSTSKSKKQNLFFTFLQTSMLSWLILFIWAIWGWLQHGFYESLDTIKGLAFTQIQFLSAFEYVTKIFGLLNHMAFGLAHLPHDLNPFLIFFIQLWAILCAITHVLATKICILIFSIPLFTLAITAGLVDGLSKRAIRTTSLGRESTYIFHKSIPVIKAIFVMLVLLWLSLPIAIAPSPLFLSLAVLMGLLASLSASRFKKYL